MLKKRKLAQSLLKTAMGPRGRILALTGARQTGKSTLLRKTFPTYQYINLDDPLVRSQYLEQSAATLARFFPQSIWDEVQKAPGLVEKIKAAHDANPETRFVLSGSSQILLQRNIRETLAGRVALFDLYPLTLPETLTLENGLDEDVKESGIMRLISSLAEGLSPTEIFADLPPLIFDRTEYTEAERAFEAYLNFGGMPFLQTEGLSIEDKRNWLRDYARTFLQRDLADLAQLSNLEPFIKSEKVLALRTGTLLNFSDAGRLAGVSPDAMRRYMQYLEMSFQAFLLPSWQRNPSKRLSKMPRLHFLDPGICRTLTGNFESMDGAFFESAVCAEIYKQVHYSRPDWSLFHLRTSDGRELDLLLETPKGYIALEIKMSATAAQAQTRHFRELDGLLDKPFLGGVLLTQDRKPKLFSETRSLALPAQIFLGSG